jgi:hypothetical protein
MTRRSLFVGFAVTIFVGAGAAAFRWTAAAAPDLFAPASSGKALLLTLDGAQRFIDVAVNTFAVRPSIAAAAPIPTGMTKFIGVATTPLATAPGGSAFATLYVSAAIVISGMETGAAHITTKLWMRGDAATPGPLYATPKGVEVGQLDAAPTAHAIPGTANNGWTPVQIDGYLAANAVVDSLEPVWRAAEFNYQFICADCHTPHAATEYSSMQWGIFMARMAKFAKLQPDDEMFMLKWLQTTSAARDARK